MKIWYQSMTNLKTWGAYGQVLPTILNSVKDPDTVIEVHGIEKVGGMGDQFRYLEFIETAEVLDNVHRATKQGFDAFLIGNIADPGLREAREITDMPVLGLCESAAHMACIMGGKFSFITINEKFTPRVDENVARYGLSDRYVGADRMDISRLLDLDAGFEDAKARQRIMSEFEAAGRKSTEKGAEVLVAAGGVVVALLAHWGVYKTQDGTPILNGITNLVKFGEMAVRMKRLTGGFTSRRRMYAQPPLDQIGELRKHYGDHIYPTIPSGGA